jgi:hypothetical protein
MKFITNINHQSDMKVQAKNLKFGREQEEVVSKGQFSSCLLKQSLLYF